MWAPIILGAFVVLGASTAFAQTISRSASPSPASLTVLRLLPSTAQSKQKEHEGAIAACMRMWDSGTHMSKGEWAATCKRIQSRLDNLKIDWLIPQTKR